MNASYRRTAIPLASCLLLTCLVNNLLAAPQNNPLRARAPAATLPEPMNLEVHEDTAVQQAQFVQDTEYVVDPPPAQPARLRRAPSYGFHSPRHEPRGFVPSHLLVSHRQDEAQEPAGVMPEPMPEGEVIEHFDPLNQHHACAGPGCRQCLIPCPILSWDNMEFFGGAAGFTGPMNRGETGSFGFEYGLNWAAPMPCMTRGNLGAQIGFRGVQSNLSGAEFSDEIRNQYFVTAGLFRRVDWGIQGGVVVDYMNTRWYYDADLWQVRGELSWMYPSCHEIGFWFAAGSTNDTVISTLSGPPQTQVTENVEVTDLYAFFYRRRLESCGAEGRFFAGWSSDSDGLIGGDFRLPIAERWAVETGFSYLIPTENRGFGGHSEESWNVAMNIVWFPGCRTARSKDYYRPLMNVAGNGNFMTDRR